MLFSGNWLTFISLAMASEGPATPVAAPDFPFWMHLIKILIILSAMIGVLLLGGALWKKFAPKSQRQPALIQVLATHYLNPKQALILVAVGKETFLLASSANNLNIIPLAGEENRMVTESLPPPIIDERLIRML